MLDLDERGNPIFKNKFKIYFGMQNKGKLYYSVDCMLNAVYYWNKKQKKFIINYKPDKHKKIFMDSGGFLFFMKSGKYPFTHEEYLNFIKKFNVDYFANMDYPCVPETLKRNNITVKQNIKKTVFNNIALKDLIESEYSNLLNKFIPVVQGWTLKDYLFCIDKLKAYGLLSDYIAIGSICRRTAADKIINIIKSVKENLPKYIKIHAFGLHLNVIKKLISTKQLNLIDSSDTNAWIIDYTKFGRIPVFTGRRLLKLHYKKSKFLQKKITNEEVINICLKNYVDYTNYLFNKKEGVKTG